MKWMTLSSLSIGVLILQDRISPTICQNLHPQSEYEDPQSWLQDSRTKRNRNIAKRAEKEASLLDLKSPLKDQKQPRIVGGMEATEGRYPYQVALLIEDEVTAFCGGSLIAPNWVLSAAHCADLGNRVQLGRHDFGDPNEINFEEIKIKRQIIHPSYNLFTLENDAMLIELEKSSAYPPVTLDSGATTLNINTIYTIMGWGTTSSFGPQSDLLLEAQVDPVSLRVCNRRYSIYGGISPSTMMCASRKGKDSCQGDSGGPLLIKGATVEEDVQVGIVSWGLGCGKGYFPGVYSRVDSFEDFIVENVRNVSWSV